MYKALYLSPMIPSYNLPQTLRFFTAVLGFQTVIDTETYAVCQKDHLTVHILRAGQDIGQIELYMEVDNIADAWHLIKDKLEGITYREPFDREYGMREIHIAIPHTKALLFIGQLIQSEL